MTALPARQYGILITLGLAAVAAAIVGAVLFTSGRASEVDLTTANFVPADAGIYVAFNTDLASSQWVAAFKLIERLGEDDPEDRLHESAEDGGVDWEKDVAPFLGGNAAIYLRGFNIDSLSAQGAVIVRCKDAERALEVVMDETGLEFEKETHRGVTYYNGGGMVAAQIGKHLVIAMDVESMEEVIDVSEGKIPSLAGVADFKSLRDELTNNFLAFVYVNAGALTEGLFGGDAELRDALEASGAGDLALKPGAAVIGAKNEGFEFQAATVGKPGVVSPMLQPRSPKFAAMVPADAAVFVSTTNIAQTWKEVRERSGADLDKFIREQGEYRNLDDALRSAGQEIGLRNVEELINLFTGEMSVAVWFTSTSEEDAEVVLLADVKDEANARKVIDSLATSSSSSRPRTEKVNNVEMTFVKGRDGQELGYAVTGGYMVFGTAKAARSIIAKDFGPNLASAPNYQKSVKQMPTALGTFAYLDLATLLRLTEGGVPVNLDKAQKALRGTIFNMVDERGVVRVSGVVTIAEK